MGSTFSGTPASGGTTYASLAELKAYLWPDGTTPDTTNDAILTSILDAVSRRIEGYCLRRFWTTGSDEVRYFATRDDEYLFPDIDILSITTLQTDDDGDRTYENTWAATDYDLLPNNAALDGLPYTYLRIAPAGNHTLSRAPRGVKITGKFGYCATGSHPAQVHTACLLQAARWWKRRDAPFGILSNPAGGDMRLIEALDPDVEMMLADYRRGL